MQTWVQIIFVVRTAQWLLRRASPRWSWRCAWFDMKILRGHLFPQPLRDAVLGLKVWNMPLQSPTTQQASIADRPSRTRATWSWQSKPIGSEWFIPLPISNVEGEEELLKLPQLQTQLQLQTQPHHRLQRPPSSFSSPSRLCSQCQCQCPFLLLGLLPAFLPLVRGRVGMHSSRSSGSSRSSSGSSNHGKEVARAKAIRTRTDGTETRPARAVITTTTTPGTTNGRPLPVWFWIWKHWCLAAQLELASSRLISDSCPFALHLSSSCPCAWHLPDPACGWKKKRCESFLPAMGWNFVCGWWFCISSVRSLLGGGSIKFWKAAAHGNVCGFNSMLRISNRFVYLFKFYELVQN